MPEDRLLEGKVAVVTGAGAGIGAATGELFAEHGATVYLADIDGDAARSVARGIGANGGKATSLTIDVRQLDDITQLHDRVLQESKRIDILVNNVGHWVAVREFLDGDVAHWQALYDINLLHIFRVTHAFLPSMQEQGSGSIINVGSVEGVRGYPLDPIYAAFKAAVVQFTRSLGVDVASRGVRVNGIAPDMTNSAQSNFVEWDPPGSEDHWPDWVPLGRMGLPIDQARAILFLASELSSFVIGQTINTDGGTVAAGGWYPSSKRAGRRWTNRPVDA